VGKSDEGDLETGPPVPVNAETATRDQV